MQCMYANTSAKHDFKILIFQFSPGGYHQDNSIAQKEAEENTAQLAKVKIGRMYHTYVGRCCSINCKLTLCKKKKKNFLYHFEAMRALYTNNWNLVSRPLQLGHPEDFMAIPKLRVVINSRLDLQPIFQPSSA